MKKRIGLLLIAFAVSATLVFAQNSVSAYTTLEEPLAMALFEEFTIESGITVNFVRVSGGEAVARMEAE